MSERKKILWLVSWYPNRYDPFDGDFIQRHARAAASFDDIHVLFIKQAEEQAAVEKVLRRENGLTEQVIYLPKQNGFAGKARSFLQWRRVLRAEIRRLVQSERPHLVHVHVPWKAGLMALWVKRTFGIPFLITEHWGIYNNVVADNIHTKSFLVRRLLKKIYQEAVSFASVSRYLGEGVTNTVVRKAFTVIPNVVDTSIFYLSEEKHHRFTFLHVSNMAPLKNVEGILAAFQKFLLQTGADAQLVLVGNRDEHYPELAGKMGLLNKSVFFRGEIPYGEVAAEMQKAHVFVLNSHMENSPCVIGEALCCGLPVIATAVGGVPELVSERDGLLIPPGDNHSLARAMGTMHQRLNAFSQRQIADAAGQRFSLLSVGVAFHALYRS